MKGTGEERDISVFEVFELGADLRYSCIKAAFVKIFDTKTKSL